MAVKLITKINRYVGTAAEIAAMTLTGIPAGSTFLETDTGLVKILSQAGVLVNKDLPATKTVTIASGATGLSAAVDLTGMQIMQIQMPATWVAANLTLQTSDAQAGTYQDLYDDLGAEVVITATQGRNIAINYNMLNLAGLSWVKFRSGTAALPVDQTASRTIKIIGKV